MNANRKTRVAWATLLGVSAFAGACYYYKKHHKAAPSVEEDNLLSDKLPEELCLSAETPGVFFGTVPGYPEQYVGKPLHTDGHVLVAGSSGSGKTTSIVYPTMETAAGFGIYLDVKGDLAEHWHQVNGESGKKCFVLNPYDPAQSNCWYDPFSPMKDDPEHLADHAYQLAKMLIPSPSLAHDKIWYEAAAAYAAGAIIYYYDQGVPFVETLRKINVESVEEMINQVMDNKADAFARIFLSKFAEMDEKAIAGIGMELTSNLAPFSTSVAICNACSPGKGKEPLTWSQLNTEQEPFDVILVFPEDKLTAERPLLCAIINQLIETLERRPMRSYDHRSELSGVLLMLDEFPRLGRIPALKEGLTTLRSRGVTMVLLLQSLASLDEIYGTATARVIIENCTYKAVLGTTDVESQRYLSELVGSTVIHNESASLHVDLPTHSIGVGHSYSDERRPVIYPHAFYNLANNMVLIAPQGTYQVKKHAVYPGNCLFSYKRYIPMRFKKEGSL